MGEGERTWGVAKQPGAKSLGGKTSREGNGFGTKRLGTDPTRFVTETGYQE